MTPSANLKELLSPLSNPAVRFVAGGFMLVVIAATSSTIAARMPDRGSSLDDGPRVSAPPGLRIKVQVLNGTKIPGLAARATRYLRDRGFDVVESGTSDKPRQSTVVYDRSGKADAARLVALAFGVAGIQAERDTSRYLDVTVVLGEDWAAPAGSLSP